MWKFLIYLFTYLLVLIYYLFMLLFLLIAIASMTGPFSSSCLSGNLWIVISIIAYICLSFNACGNTKVHFVIFNNVSASGICICKFFFVDNWYDGRQSNTRGLSLCVFLSRLSDYIYKFTFLHIYNISIPSTCQRLCSV